VLDVNLEHQPKGGYGVDAGETRKQGRRFAARFLVGAVVLLLAGCFLTPRWPRYYGGARDDGGLAVAVTSDGGFVVAGFTASSGAGDSDVYVIRTDGSGKTLWTRTCGGSGPDVAYSIQPTRDGGYIVAGSTSSFGGGGLDAYLVKLNAEGETAWTRTYGGTQEDVASAVRQTPDDGFIIAGWTFIAGPQVYEGWLVKTDANGDTVWTRTFGGTNDDKFLAVEPAYGGGFIAVGYTASFGAGNYDFWFVKTDDDGNVEWTRTHGGDLSDQAFAVCQTRDSSFVAAGISSSFRQGRDDAFVVRVSRTGDSLWARSFGTTGLDFAHSVCQNSDGDLYLAGASDSRDGTLDAWLFKTDIDGDIYWAVAFGEDGLDQARSVQALSDNGCIMAGTSNSDGAGKRDVMLIRTDTHGDPAR
jgi:hypothetical protein